MKPVLQLAKQAEHALVSEKRKVKPAKCYSEYLFDMKRLWLFEIPRGNDYRRAEILRAASAEDSPVHRVTRGWVAKRRAEGYFAKEIVLPVTRAARCDGPRQDLRWLFGQSRWAESEKLSRQTVNPRA